MLSRQGANNTHARTRMQRQCEANHQHLQICLPSYLWVLFHMLLISIAPNTCSGACANTHLYILNETVSHKPGPSHCHSFVQPASIVSTQTSCSTHPIPQPSRRSPECSSKLPLTHASNYRQKVNASTVRTDQSGRGTYRVSPT